MKNTIHKKILMATIITVIPAILICGLSITIYLKPFLTDIFAKDTQSAVENSAHQIGYYLDEVTTYSKDISFQPIVQNALAMGSEGITYSYFKSVFDVENYLDQYIVLHDNIIQDIFLVYADGKTVETTRKYGNLLDGPVYEELLKPETRNGVTIPHQISINKDMEKVDVIACVSSINSTSTLGKYLGKIVVLIKYDELVKPLETFHENYEMEMYNEKNQRLYPRMTEAEREAELGNPVREMGEKPCYVYEIDLANESLKIMGITSTKYVQEGVSNIIRIMVFIVLLCAGLSALVSYIVTKNLTMPLNTLIGAMKKVSLGFLDVEAEVHSGDEIEEAAMVFNHMLKDINSYTAELLERDKMEYEMAMQMLIYQINPHFIYNTLNCVICLARKKSYESIIDLTRSFIILLQCTLRTKPDTMTTVGEEMEYTNHYVSILQYSYENVEAVVWDIEERFMDCPIPRLILYPILENSIFHGILTEDRVCHVYVTVGEEEDWMVIDVRDDGRGIDDDMLEMLNQRLQSGENLDGHIGLANVNSRIKLLYGEGAGVDIQSRREVGTWVRVRVGIRGRG